jgi:transcriptional regulator with XRE-family HTH domain
MAAEFDIRPEIADKLAKLAKARGVTVDELLQEALSRLGPPLDGVTEISLEDFERDMDLIAEGLERLPAYRGNYSREEIYLDHD